MLPATNGRRLSNSDPVTGQAAWFDLRVRIEKCEPRRGDTRAAIRHAAAAAGLDPAPAVNGATRSPSRREAREAIVMTSLPAAPARSGSASSSISTPASAVTPARPTARNGTPAAPAGRSPTSTPTRPSSAASGSTASSPTRRAAPRATRAPCISPRTVCIARSRHCVTVCPTGASYKRAEDGIVLIDHRQMHRLQAVRLGLPLRRARARRRPRRDEEMHALRRPESTTKPARSGSRARLRLDLPDHGAPFRRFQRSRIQRLASRARARRLRSGAGDRLPADEQIPAVALAPKRAPDASQPDAAGAARKHVGGFLRWVDRALSR